MINFMLVAICPYHVPQKYQCHQHTVRCRLSLARWVRRWPSWKTWASSSFKSRESKIYIDLRASISRLNSKCPIAGTETSNGTAFLPTKIPRPLANDKPQKNYGVQIPSRQTRSSDSTSCNYYQKIPLDGSTGTHREDQPRDLPTRELRTVAAAKARRQACE